MSNYYLIFNTILSDSLGEMLALHFSPLSFLVHDGNSLSGTHEY